MSLTTRPPVISIGRRVTSEDVAGMLDERR